MVSLVCSRFSVRVNGVHKGVIVPRNDGWVFVPYDQRSDAPLQSFPGDSPEACLLAAGISIFVKETS